MSSHPCRASGQLSFNHWLLQPWNHTCALSRVSLCPALWRFKIASASWFGFVSVWFQICLYVCHCAIPGGVLRYLWYFLQHLLFNFRFMHIFGHLHFILESCAVDIFVLHISFPSYFLKVLIITLKNSALLFIILLSLFSLSTFHCVSLSPTLPQRSFSSLLLLSISSSKTLIYFRISLNNTLYFYSLPLYLSPLFFAALPGLLPLPQPWYQLPASLIQLRSSIALFTSSAQQHHNRLL